MSKSRMPTWFSLILLGVGLLAVGIPGIFVYMRVTAKKVHPDTQEIPSVMKSPPLTKWAGAAEQARRIVRTSISENNLAGLSIAVGIDGDIVWTEGFGFADIENGSPVTPSHRFRTGTASIVLTSAAIGLLLDEGRLKLDDEIQKYVPDFPRKQWPVTIRQVMGQVARSDRDDPTDLKSLFVRNSRGEMISLDNLVTFEEATTPSNIYHFNRYKSATISSGLAPGKTVGDGVKTMQDIAKKLLDDTFATSLTGSSRDFAESSSNTSFAFILALGLIFLILAAQFESFIDPLIIMFTVPLAIAGALLSLWIFGQTLNIFSQIGMIMLIGLVTKNGILIVEFANQNRLKGMAKRDAVIYAASQRLRPILMTSLAMALGALPIALSLGAAATSRIPLGIVIVGGIIFSLVLTLFVIPAMYSYLSSEKKRNELEIMDEQALKQQPPVPQLAH